MNSERFDELTAALLDGSLSDAERAELIDAATADPKRGEELVALLRLEPLLNDALAQSAGSAGFAGRLNKLLQAKADGQVFAAKLLTKLQRSESPAWRSTPALAAAAVLVIALLGIVFRSYLQRSDAIAQLEISTGGKVFLVDGEREQALTQAAKLRLGQGVRCESGTAVIQFLDGSIVSLNSGGLIKKVTDRYENTAGVAVNFDEGELNAEISHQATGSAFRIITKTAVVRVIGTRFSVSAEPKSTKVEVRDGVVELKRSADGAKVEVTKGFTAVAAPEVELAAVPSPSDRRDSDEQATATAISYLGGAGEDSVVGTIIQNDGTVILAANFSGSQWGGTRPRVLAGADDSSKGVIVRLSPTGRTVETVTRIASAIRDLDTDSTGALYVAAENEVIKINPAVTRIEWRFKTDAACSRLAATRDGLVAALIPAGKQKVQIVDSKGTVTGGFSPPFSANDVAVDGTRKLIFVCGSRSGNVKKGAVGGVACLSAFSLNGEEVWRDYGFDPATPSELLAHTSGERVAFGRDGNLYCAFYAVGGSHIFTRDPKSLDKAVDLHGNDAFNQPYATGPTHITFVGRFDPATGDLLAGQQLLGRDKDRKGSSINPTDGDIAADEDGRVYLVGQAHQGGPNTRDAFGKAEFSNHEGFVCIFTPDLRHREFYSTFNATENGGSALRSVFARRFPAAKRANFSAGGNLFPDSGGLRIFDAIQSRREGSSEGCFIIRGSAAP